MPKRCIILISSLFIVLSMPAGAVAQGSSLTIPGSIPTLAPLSLPMDSLTISQSETPTPTPVAARAKKTSGGFSVSAVVSRYIKIASAFVLGIIGHLKLNDAVKKLLMQLVQNGFHLLLSLSEKLDPLIRKFLTDAIARLPGSARGFMSIFIPFLTMAGKVILGVVGGILVLKVFFFVLGKLLSSLFHPKRRRR